MYNVDEKMFVRVMYIVQKLKFLLKSCKLKGRAVTTPTLTTGLDIC